MRYIRIGLSILCSLIKLSIKKLFGCKVSFEVFSLISPCAHLYTEHGGNIKIANRTGIKANTEIKANGGKITFGNNCFVNRNCMIVAHEQISIDENVTIGPGTYIYDHDHDGNGGYKTKPITIEKNAWIGANCVILKGVTIGEGAVVAAGCVITKDVPPQTIVRQKRESMLIKKLETQE